MYAAQDELYGDAGASGEDFSSNWASSGSDEVAMEALAEVDRAREKEWW